MTKRSVSSHKRGQILLIVVLTTIVALTVGLSVASRTITNLRISRQSEESQRAFQAAEAGVEQILQAKPECLPGATCSSVNFSQNNSTYSTKVSYPSGASFVLNGGELVDQAVGLDVWLSDYPDFLNGITGSVTIYWSTNDQSNCSNPGGSVGPLTVKPALEIIMLSGNKLNPTTTKYLLEANGCARITSAQTPDAGGIPAGMSTFYQNSKTIAVTNGLIMRVIPIFNSTKIAITSSTSLPRQGTSVESTGKAGETSRKVVYFSSHPQVPLEIFPYSLISQ